MSRNQLPVGVRILTVVVIVMVIICAGSILSNAQTPAYSSLGADCCIQATQQTRQIKALSITNDSLRLRIDTMRATGTRLLQAKDLRIQTVLWKANDSLAIAADRLTLMVTSRNAYADSLTSLRAEVGPTQAKLAKYEGRTWAGREIRKVGNNVAKPIGWAVVVVGVVKIFSLFL